MGTKLVLNMWPLKSIIGVQKKNKKKLRAKRPLISLWQYKCLEAICYFPNFRPRGNSARQKDFIVFITVSLPGKLTSYPAALKGVCHEIFDLQFFS